jgi:hypothetical protein
MHSLMCPAEPLPRSRADLRGAVWLEDGHNRLNLRLKMAATP